jgi:hypothetical protein
MRPKPVKNVETYDGRFHEVDFRQTEKSYVAWAFVDGRLIEGTKAATQLKAIANWKKEYQTILAKGTDKELKPKVSKKKVVKEAVVTEELPVDEVGVEVAATEETVAEEPVADETDAEEAIDESEVVDSQA